MRRISLEVFTAVLLAASLSFATSAWGQLFENKDWKESTVPPPPAFDAKRALEIEMPLYMSLRFAVDPATITITPDGVVRYVVIASRSGADGASSAYYEGIRCATEEVKTYARHNDGKWELVSNPEWKRFLTLNSSYNAALAIQILCQHHAPRRTVRDMINHFKQPLASD